MQVQRIENRFSQSVCWAFKETGFSPLRIIFEKNLENLQTYKKNLRTKIIFNLILHNFASYDFFCQVDLTLAKVIKLIP